MLVWICSVRRWEKAERKSKESFLEIRCGPSVSRHHAAASTWRLRCQGLAREISVFNGTPSTRLVRRQDSGFEVRILVVLLRIHQKTDQCSNILQDYETVQHSVLRREHISYRGHILLGTTCGLDLRCGLHGCVNSALSFLSGWSSLLVDCILACDCNALTYCSRIKTSSCYYI